MASFSRVNVSVRVDSRVDSAGVFFSAVLAPGARVKVAPGHT